MARINIIGAAGAGKSTLAAALGEKGLPVVELDQLYWRRGWVATPAEEFRAVVAAAAAGAAWAMCGNYSTVRDLVWGRADTIVWLDYPLRLTLWRLWRRTWRRIVTQEELWGGNRESWRTQFLSRDSLLWYALRTHRRRIRATEEALGRPEYAHLQVYRLQHPRTADEWLRAYDICPTEIGQTNAPIA